MMDRMEQHNVPQQCTHSLTGSKELHLLFEVCSRQECETLSRFFVNSLVAGAQRLDCHRPLNIRRLCFLGESATRDSEAHVGIEFGKMPCELAKRPAGC